MLRFTHDGLDSRAAYAHGQHGKKSVYESLHDSWSKRSHPEDFLFDIAIKDVLIYTIGNRRFASFRAYHSWSWDKLLFVRCEVVSKGKRPHLCKTSQRRSATLTDWCPRGWRGCGSWRSNRSTRRVNGASRGVGANSTSIHSHSRILVAFADLLYTDVVTPFGMFAECLHLQVYPFHVQMWSHPSVDCVSTAKSSPKQFIF